MRGKSYLRDIISITRDHIIYNFRMLSRPSTIRYHDILVPVCATDQLYSFRRMFFTGEYEIQELVSLKQVLRPGDVVVEFGAGCGVVSTFIAKRIGPSGRLTTYEANADLMPSITALASANNVKFDVEYVAVGVMDGSTTFFRNRQILSSSILDRKDQLAGERITVPVKGLSGIIERHKPTVLVMDVEGAETSLLTTVMPASVRAVVLEMHPHIIGDKLVSGICAKLIESGFNLSIEFSHEKNLAFVR